MPPGVTTQSTIFAVAAAVDGRPVDAACDPAALVESAIVHRVSALLARSDWAHGLPLELLAVLAEDARLAALHAAVIDEDLRVLLDRLHDRGISCLVTKGAQLSHRFYPSSALRPRTDTDLLIAPADRTAVKTALLECGYAASARTSGSVILGQFQVERPLRAGITHFVDVHWRPAAPLVFERTFDVAALIDAGEPLPPLGAHARGPAARDALALACIHLVAHHWHHILLIWLLDIRLLVETLESADCEALVDEAVRGRYTVPLDVALKTTRLYFTSAGVDALIDRLGPRVRLDEPGAALIQPVRRKVDDLLFDLRVAGWRQGAQLLREHVLPPAEYMRATSNAPLPLAYTLRLLRGVRRWF
jgi:Uncharacterised nucleotidyltransferase